MLRAFASLVSFAATCLAAPALAESLAGLAGGGLAVVVGHAGIRLLLSAAHNLQSEEAPREGRCPPRTTSSTP